MVPNNLTAFLDEQHVKYTITRHSPAFTAPEVAASAHVAGRNFAKTVIVKIDGLPAMLILPATRRLMLPELRELLETDDATLATEEEILRWFPDCELGAMPPLGNLYGMKVYIAASLVHESEIAFNAGTHTDIIRMSFEEFDRIVRPLVVDMVTT